MTTKTIAAADLPQLGQPLAGGAFVARYWLGDTQYALIDLGSTAEFAGCWGEFGQRVATTHASGMANTIAMAEAGSEIARQALELDAHIPSVFELHVLMVAKEAGLIADLREDDWYWSSTQSSAYSAFSMDFEYGWQSDLGKNDERLVRPVRSLIIQ